MHLRPRQQIIRFLSLLIDLYGRSNNQAIERTLIMWV
jgi:hypothetical protein